MATSILTSTKQILGIAEDYTPFDLDIITHINAALSTAAQLGVGPSSGFFIESDAEDWTDLHLPGTQLSLLKTYVYLRVRMLFDPPSTGYLVTAMENQLEQYEWRLNIFRETAEGPYPEEFEGYDIVDGGEA
ncbi:MAG TPA: hypothetical protein PLN81_07965 [Bacillota bacterium]|jgi:hypothetical protein|nr:hypothetical protein [Bacillota bacterium]